MRQAAVVLTVILVAAGVLWWLPGSNNAAAIWVALVFSGLTFGGWYLSKQKEEDGK